MNDLDFAGLEVVEGVVDVAVVAADPAEGEQENRHADGEGDDVEGAAAAVAKDVAPGKGE